MLNATICQSARFWLLVAAGPVVNGCAVATEDAEQAPTGQESAAQFVTAPAPSQVPVTAAPPPVQHHHICYEDSRVVSGGVVTQVTYKLRCRASDGTCSINGGTGTTYGGETVASATYSPISVYNDTATFTFADGSTQTCSYAAGGGQPVVNGTVLDGYTTDASGLVTTGVWKRQFTPNPPVALPSGNIVVEQQIRSAPGFNDVGGGVVGVPDNAFIAVSERGTATTASNLTPVPHSNTVYVIGMRVEGILNLSSVIGTTSGSSVASGNVAHPSGQVTLPSGRIALGGGGSGYSPFPGDGYGQQYLTASQPVLTAGCLGPISTQCVRAQVAGWNVRSKDHWVSAPGWVNVDLMTLSTDVMVNGSAWHFVGYVNRQSVASSSTPTAVVSGDAGEFALTGIGAFVNWDNGTNPGNLLWELKPRADIAGAEVGSTDHGATSPAAITAFTLGVKLVPGHS